jgi:hypothetical protein
VPVSDDGGSSSEIQRVLGAFPCFLSSFLSHFQFSRTDPLSCPVKSSISSGGPALGDIRSRLIRLIPASPPDSPLGAFSSSSFQSSLIDLFLTQTASVGSWSTAFLAEALAAETSRQNGRRLLREAIGCGGCVAFSHCSFFARSELTVALFQGIPGDRKETIRAFLVHFQSAVLKKAQRVCHSLSFQPAFLH